MILIKLNLNCVEVFEDETDGLVEGCRVGQLDRIGEDFGAQLVHMLIAQPQHFMVLKLASLQIACTRDRVPVSVEIIK